MREKLFPAALFVIAAAAPIALALHLVWPVVDGYMIENAAFALLILPGMFGAMQAWRRFRLERFMRDKPMQISFDVESGYAHIVVGNGNHVSMHVPENVVMEGPDAVGNYILAEFGIEVRDE